MLNILNLIDDAKCYETIRELRWPDGVSCPSCGSHEVTRQGFDTTQPHRQKYRCKACGRCFDDLTDTIFAGHRQPLRTWVLCLCFMGLNLSNQQIGQELGLNKDDVQRMTAQLREGVVARSPTPRLDGEVEADEAYVIAGHKGHTEAVKKRVAQAVATALGAPGDGGPWPRRSHRSSGSSSAAGRS